MPTTIRPVAAASLAAAFAASGASAQPAEAATTTLYALVAANATQPFGVLIANFEKAHPGVTVVPSYAGTQILEQQLESGAPCDVFLSADRSHIEKIASEGLIEPYERISETHEIVVVPKANPAKIRSFRDLANPGVKLVIGVDTVPIGIYTREILAKANSAYGADFEKRALANVVSFETNVKQVLAKAELGEADAGIVYQTDVDVKAAVSLDAIQIPAEINREASNYVAVSKKAGNAALAAEFQKYALSPAGRAVFKRFGYDEK